MRVVPWSPSRRAALACGLGVLLPLLGAGLRAEDEAFESRPPSQAVDVLRAEVDAAVAEGRLSADAAAAADEIAFDLEKELIRWDAEIEILRLEAARFEGEAQQQALDSLIAAAAARQLASSERIGRLEALARPSACDEPPRAAAEAAPDPDGGDERAGGMLGVSIAFEAEDVLEDPVPR